MTDDQYPNRHLMGERNDRLKQEEESALNRYVTEHIRAVARERTDEEQAAMLLQPKGESAGDVLRRLGTDAELWAAEFDKHHQGLGLDMGDLLVWFANAIEAGRSAGQPAPRFGPVYTPTPGSDKWIAVDLDGTLAEGVWTPENPVDTIGAPIQHGLNQCARYSSAGWKIVIHTSRPWYHYEMIEEWLEKHGVPFRRIVCGKLFAFRYCDDRGVNASEQEWV